MQLALTLLFLLLPHFSPAATLDLEQFQAKMRKHVAALSGKTTASVRVEVLGAGTLLFAHNDDGKIIPASNTKLLTTIASLGQLGPAYTFETKVLRKGKDLVLQGNGDPYLVSERLYLLARDVARAGVKEVGSIRVNNSAYSQDYTGLMDWDESGEPFTAMVSPTSLNFNSIELHVMPTDGAHPRVELGPVPHTYAKILNEAKMVAGRGKSLTLRRVKTEGDVETFRLSGTLGKGSAPVVEYASVSLPESHVAHVFAALLRAEGIKVEKDFGGASFSPESGEQIASLGSFPLLELARLYNTFSNNFMTEQVFQAFGAAAMGGAASLEKSQQAMAKFLSERDACRQAVITNGSGLSWDNRISAHCFTQVLQGTYRDFRVFADLMGSLPIGGQTGTLKNRFKRVGPDIQPQKVRAKTGTIWSKQVVTSLVGFTQLASGEQVVFSLVENDQRNDPGLLSGLKDWEDQCVEYMQQLKL